MSRQKWLSPSIFAAHAAGLRAGPLTFVAKEAAQCAMCGALISVGEACGHARFSQSFTDRASLAVRESDFVCWACRELWTQEFLQKYSKSVITRDGFFKLAGTAEKASFFLAPPEPPFIVILSNAKQQHLIWRARVNLSKERYLISLGNRLLSMRHETIQRGVQAMRRIFEAADAQKIKHASSPWPMIHRDLEFVEAHLDTRIESLRSVYPMEFQLLESLSPGEQYAVGMVGQAGISAPNQLTQTLPVST